MDTKIKVCFIFLIISCFLFWGGLVDAQEVIRGEVVAVNIHSGSFLLQNGENIEEFKIGPYTKLIRNKQNVSLLALRAITEGDFQEAEIKLDAEGIPIQIKVEHYALPVEIKEINQEDSILKLILLNSQELMEVEYRAEIDLKKNNRSIELDFLKTGEQGLLILGLQERVREIKIISYEY